MNLRQLAKTGAFFARHAGVRALALPRGMPWMRRRLHLPANRPLDPLAGDAGGGITVTRLDDGERFPRPLPELPCDQAARPFYATRAEEIVDPSFVVSLPGGAFWGSPGGAVFDGHGRFIPSLTRDPWGARLHTVWTRLSLPKPRRLAGRVLYLVTPEVADNFHHWMIDLLPRLGLLGRAGYAPADFDHIILNHHGRRYQLESLARLGVPLERIRASEPGAHFRADELVVPSLKRINQSLPPADAAFLRESFLGAPPPASAGRRIFVTRGDAAFRRLLNEAEILPTFRHHGFEVVSPATLTLPEQAALFASAEWIAGPAGAAFANLVFAPASARVLEISPPAWLSVHHWMISARRGLRHTVLLGDGACRTGVPDIGDRWRNFTLSPEKLSAWLPAAPR